MRLGQTSIIHFLSQIGTTVIGAIATIYFARVLGASPLGKYFLIIALLTWAKIAGNLGIHTAITKRISEGTEPGAFLSTGLVAQLGLFTIVAAALFVGRKWVTQYVGMAIIEAIIALLFVQLAFGLVSAVLRGQHAVHISAILRPIERLLRTAFQLVLVFIGYGVVGLIAGYILSAAITTVVGAWVISINVSRPKLEHFKSVFDFARYSWLGQLMGNSFNSIDTIVLGVFVSSALIGIYEVSWNIASILAVFGASLSQTLFPEMSKLSMDEDDVAIGDLTEKAVAFAGLFTIPGLIGVFIVGDIVLRIYGTEFKQGHTVLVILVFARLLFAYQSQFANTLNAIDRPDITFRINTLFIVLNIGLNVLLVYEYGWIGAAVATSISAGIALLLSYYLVDKLLEFGLPISEVGRQITAAIGMAVIVFLLRNSLVDSYVNLLIFVIFGVLTYFAILSGLSRRFRRTVISNINLFRG